jgi:hypothetical protein
MPWFISGRIASRLSSLKNHILNHKKEFVLPSGEIAVIPESWFSQYGNLLHFSEGGDHLNYAGTT